MVITPPGWLEVSAPQSQSVDDCIIQQEQVDRRCRSCDVTVCVATQRARREDRRSVVEEVSPRRGPGRERGVAAAYREAIPGAGSHADDTRDVGQARESTVDGERD